ncbi:hypothetical protein [Streptomyces pseudovenezuelae]|uniref:hypothetical protein n=1 Tax=Streptomyces pseudovenezuelae TaxID=67350 RepID=UPI0037197C1F
MPTSGTPRPAKGQVWVDDEDGDDVLTIESFDGAYAVAHSQKLGQQILVNGGHFGKRYRVLPGSASDEPTPWRSLWIEPAGAVTDEQEWAAGVDAALHRGGKGFVVQAAPPEDTSYLRTGDGFEVRVIGDDSAYAEVLRALPSFEPPARVTVEQPQQ